MVHLYLASSLLFWAAMSWMMCSYIWRVFKRHVAWGQDFLPTMGNFVSRLMIPLAWWMKKFRHCLLTMSKMNSPLVVMRAVSWPFTWEAMNVITLSRWPMWLSNSLTSIPDAAMVSCLETFSDAIALTARRLPFLAQAWHTSAF